MPNIARRSWLKMKLWFSTNFFWLLFASAWLILGISPIVIDPETNIGRGAYVNWDAVAAFATWILAGGIVVAIWQIKEARKSTNAQIAMDLFRELRDEKAKNTLRLIYNLRLHDIERLCLDESTNIGIQNLKNEINSLLDRFEMLGSLVNRGIIDKPLAIEAYGGAPALRCWYKLTGYIRKETCKRGYFAPNYEGFTKLCLDYFHDRHIEVNFYEEGADGKIESKMPLITLFKLNSSLRPRSFKEIGKARKRGDRR